LNQSSLHLSGIAAHVAALARFCAVGLICFMASLASMTVLCELAHLHYMHAFFITFVIANVLGFWLNGRFTYVSGKSLDRGAPLRYVLVNIALFGLGSLVLRLLVESLHVWYLAAVVVVATINAPVSFLMHRWISYRVGAPRRAVPDGAN
jgi:putative flippase GtrA